MLAGTEQCCSSAPAGYKVSDSPCLPAVNVSEPDDFDIPTTQNLLKKYDLKAAGSLVRSLP